MSHLTFTRTASSGFPAGTPVAGHTTPSVGTTTMTLTETSSLAVSPSPPSVGAESGAGAAAAGAGGASAEPERLVLRLHRTQARLRRLEKQRQNDLRVEWEEGVVDNEHLNRKKSKSTLPRMHVFIVHCHHLSPLLDTCNTLLTYS